MPGAKADLILLKDDPFLLNPHEIGAIQPLATMINQDWVYLHPDLSIGV